MPGRVIFHPIRTGLRDIGHSRQPEVKIEMQRSKLGLFFSGVYLLLALGSWVLPLIASPQDSLAGIFLVLFVQPWASLWVWFSDALQLDSFVLTMTVMLVGILFNSWIIYRVVAWFSRR